VLQPLELDLLVTIDRLTGDTYLPIDQDAVLDELGRMGSKLPHAMWLYYAAQQLRDDGYLEANFAGGMTIVSLELTIEGREAAVPTVVRNGLRLIDGNTVSRA
jgi:hypothetical protein